MVTGARWVVLGVCLLLAAVAAYFFAGEANRPATFDVPPAADPTSGAPPPAEAPALAAPAPDPAGAKPAPKGETATAPVPDGQVRVHGVVAREKGVPSPGASVVLQLVGRESLTAAADAEGRFSFRTERPPHEADYGLVVVRDAEGRTGHRVVWWVTGGPGGPTKPLADVDLGEIFLFPVHALEVHAHEPSGVTAETEIWVAPPMTVTSLPFARVRSDARGRGLVPGLTPGTWYVVAWVPGRARGTAFAVVPRASSDPLEIVLDPVRDVVVTVEEKGTGAPVPGATLTLTETIRGADYVSRAPYLPAPTAAPTGADGRTTIRGLAAKASLRVSAEAAGFASESEGRFGARGLDLAPDATTLTVSLSRRRRVAWPVEAGELPPPPDGSVLRLSAPVGTGVPAPPAEGRMEGGRLVADGFGPGYVHALATAADGSTARLYAEPEKAEGHPTSFFRRRRIDVRLTWADGKPAAGLTVGARNQGNNTMGTPVTTDAEGRAALTDLEVQQADVYVDVSRWQGGPFFGGRRVGTCDLAVGDGRVEAVLPRQREVLVRVWADGEPGIPAGFGPAYLPAVEVLEQDREAGLLRMRVWPPSATGAMKVAFQAPGWTVASADVPATSGPEPVEVRVDARRAGSLRVETVRPKDGAMRLRLERWDPERGTWVAGGYDTQMFGAGQAQVDAEGRWTLPTLAPGRYRARETYSGAISAEVDVRAGDEPTRLAFDLSGVGFVTGRVVVPEGESAARIGVLRGDLPRTVPYSLGWESPPGSASTDPTGNFRLRVPGDGEYEILPVHMFLVPAAEGGRARVRAGATDVVLRLVKGPVARLRFDREPRYTMNPGEVRTEPYHLWRGPRAGAPVATGHALVEKATATWGNFDPGRYTVMLDLAPCAPVILENVELGAGETDLGTVTLSDGTSLVFEVRVPSGQTAPRVSVWATRVGDLPAYTRWGEVGAQGRIPGLGKGRFHVRAGATMGGAGVLYDQEIEVDGVTDVRIVLDVK